MTHPLQTAIRDALLAAAENRDMTLTTADVAALTEATVAAALRVPKPDAPVVLTAQQTTVLIGLALGDSTADSARRMGVAEGTVKSHRHHTYRALGASTGAEAVAIAMSLGMLRPGLRTTPYPVPEQRDGSGS